MSRLIGAIALLSFGLLVYELALTRLFAVVLFSDLAHLALSLAMLGMGVGALLQHLFEPLRPPRLLQAASGLTLAQGAAIVLATACVLYFPLLSTPSGPPAPWQVRVMMRAETLQWEWFVLLIPILSLPPLFAGVTLAGIFAHRHKDFGVLYGADLIGAGLGVAAFLPAIAWLQGADVIWLSVLSCALSAGLLAPHAAGRGLAVAAACGALVAGGQALRGQPVLQIQASAGWSEAQVVATRWTPLTRLTVFQQRDNELILLDNATLSSVIQRPQQLDRVTRMANRGLVYQLEIPPGPVAILAASAGPEVVTALHNGFPEVDAIDIEGEIFELVAERYTTPLNPYRDPRVRRIALDARSAMMRAERGRYHIIQLLNANLFGASGMLAHAWSPSLLTTQEAFDLYLDRLDEDGVLSMANLEQTRWLPRNAAAALRARGVEDPYRYMAYIDGPNAVFLLRPRPWTDAERARLYAVIGHTGGMPLVLDPGQPVADATALLRSLPGAAIGGRGPQTALPAPAPPVQTDDHPFLDSPARVGYALRHNTFPEGMVYRTLLLQAALVLAVGGAVIGLPLLLRGRQSLRGAGAVIAYVACLGGGYLAVETVLLYHLTLFIGHPSYAIAAVVLSMLVSSGLGSVYAARGPDDAVPQRLQTMLVLVLGLGLLQAFVVPDLLVGALIQAPQGVRMAIASASMAPLGFVMGTCFPYGMRLATRRSAGVVPWAWAVNGWMSVVGGMTTVLLTRTLGYSWAMVAALSAYALALVVSRRLTDAVRI
ncbi:MAG: hypothetical protein AAFV53_08160 [Myxococcota bacterium]